MDKRLLGRLEDLEADQTDGTGSILFVFERGGLFHDDITGRVYTHDELAALYDARPDILIIPTAEDASTIPAYPTHAPEGETLNDVALYNSRLRGEKLTPEQEARIDGFEAERQRLMAEYEAYWATEEPYFEEQVRRVARLDAKHQARERKGRRR